jgi:hypothetical protein
MELQVMISLIMVVPAQPEQVPEEEEVAVVAVVQVLTAMEEMLLGQPEALAQLITEEMEEMEVQVGEPELMVVLGIYMEGVQVAQRPPIMLLAQMDMLP